MVKQKKQSRKEKTENFISKWAFTILFALCIQFVVYLVVLNFVPTFITENNPTESERISAELNSLDTDGNSVTVLNPFYKTDNYYTTNGYFKSSIENPTMFIYYYNTILLIATLVLILYYFVNFMENNDGHMMKKIKQFLKEQWPFALLLIFMLWVLISSMLARDSYRSFIGCFNLKDGYLSFMMYGSMLVCSMLLIKNSEKYKKILVNTFLITATILAAVTLWNYYYLTSGVQKSAIWHEVTEEAVEDGSIDKKDIDNNDWIYNYLLTYGEDPSKTVVTIGELLFGNGGLPLGENFLIVTKRIQGENHSGIFHNSNHYGYYLSICVVVAAVMFMKQSLRNKDGEIDVKNILLSLCYLTAYIIMLKMAILNNTLGAYLGIGASLIFMIVYAALPKEKETYLKEGLSTLILILTFALLSATTVNASGKNIVYSNFSGLANDFKTLIGVNNTENVQNDIIDVSSGDVRVSGSTTTSSNNEKDVADIGSGRGQLWVAGLKMALEPGHILFGYGLENLIYEYPRFDINEGRSHNLVIQLAATTGIIGMLLYVVGIASIWIRKLKYIKEWDLYECLGMFVIVSYIISSLVGNSGFYTSGYFYLFVGFVVLSGIRKEEKVENKTKLVIDEKKEKLIDKLVRAYIGKKSDKIMSTKINIIATVFGALWFFYRKSYMLGIIYYVTSIIIVGLSIAISNFIGGIGSVVFLGLVAIIALVITSIMANKWYVADVKTKIENIVTQNNNKTEEELIEIARKKGGTNKIFLAIMILTVLFWITITIMVIITIMQWISEFYSDGFEFMYPMPK